MKGVKLRPKAVREADYPVLTFLNDEKIVEQYKESIQNYGKKARKVLDIFTVNGKGSNPFAVAQMGKFTTLALPSELEVAVEENPDYFRNTYQEPALVLRTNGDSYEPNNYIAKDLFKKVKKRTGKTPTPENPARISLKGLKPTEHKKSDYGLSFLLTDETEIIYAPEFSHKNNQRRFSRTDERGVPIFDENGNRTFYTRDNGLSSLFLDGCLGLDSDWDYILAGSVDGGRVAIVSDAVGAKNLDTYVKKLEQEKQKQIEKLEKQFQKALKILKQ